MLYGAVDFEYYGEVGVTRGVGLDNSAVSSFGKKSMKALVENFVSLTGSFLVL